MFFTAPDPFDRTLHAVSVEANSAETPGNFSAVCGVRVPATGGPGGDATAAAILLNDAYLNRTSRDPQVCRHCRVELRHLALA